MVEVGEVYTTQLTLSATSYTTITAPSGEQIKITMAYGKINGAKANGKLSIAPATGNESADGQGTRTNNKNTPPIGANSHPSDSVDEYGLQPLYMTDSDSVYISNSDGGNALTVVVQGVRVA